MTRPARRAIQFALILIALYLAIAAAAGVLVVNSIVHVNRHAPRHREAVQSIVEHQFHAPLIDASIKASDGVILKAWYVKPQIFNGSSVILLHGVDDNRENVFGYSRMFLQHGYSVLLPDSRAHGESGGPIATYGVLERYDIRAWDDWLRSRTPGCTYLFGESMGAALALEAAAVVPKLCAVVVEDPFSSLREIGYDRIAGHLGVSTAIARAFGRPVIDAAVIYARLRYRIDLSQADPRAAFAASRVPGLLIDGSEDDNIPARHARAIMQSSAAHAQLWEVQGAQHGGAVDIAPSQFESKIIQFFSDHNHPVN